MNPTLEAWLQLLGRLHPVLVHFPIALLLVAFLFELFGLRRKGGGSSITLLGLGALSAAVAATAGWFWADFEPPSARDAEALDWHRWTGVVTAALALLAWSLSLAARKRTDGGLLGTARLLLLLACLGVALAGHQGGSLVHGIQHLTEPLENAWELTFGDAVDAGDSDQNSGEAELDPSAESQGGAGTPGVSTGNLEVQELVDGQGTGTFSGTVENTFDAETGAEAGSPGASAGNLEVEELVDGQVTGAFSGTFSGTVENTFDAETGDQAPTSESSNSPNTTESSSGQVEQAGAGSAESASSADVTATEVAAVFERHCLDCHPGPPKRADSGIRLHNAEALAALVGDDPDNLDLYVIRGNVEGSYLHTLISLPDDDSSRMPPADEGYERLSPAEIQLVQDWIEAGAPLSQGATESTSDSGTAAGESAQGSSEEQVSGAIAEESATPLANSNIASSNTADSNTAESSNADPYGVIGVADPAALSAVQALGALAGRVAADTQAIDVDLHLLRDAVGDAQLDALDPLAGQLVHLHLGGTAITDAGVAAHIAKFTQLRSLNLSKTVAGPLAVGAAAKLPHLEVLNLYGTQAGDAAVLALAKSAALERVYLWDSRVTPEGGRALAELAPELGIDPAEWFADAESDTAEGEFIPPALAVNFSEQIAPIFEARCTQCHGGQKPKAGLDLTNLAAHFAGPEPGWVVSPGDPDGSDLIARVQLGSQTPGAMPPKGERLDLDQIELLRTWILQGAEL